MVTELQEAWRLFQSGHFADALEITEVVSTSENVDADSIYLQGNCLSRLGRYAEALNVFKQMLLYEPGDPRAYMAMGSTMLAQGSHDAGIDCYKKILFNDPTHLQAHIALAKILAVTGQVNQAQKHLQKALVYNPSSGQPHHALGLLCRKINAPISVIYKHFLAAVELEPDVTEYLLALGECLLNQERYDEAENFFNKASLLEPENPSIISRLAAVSVKQGNMQSAFEKIDILKSRELYMPDTAITYLLCCKHDDRCDDAIKYAESCLNHTGLDSETRRNIHSKLASVFDHKHAYNEAWQHLMASKEGIATHEQYDPVSHKAFIDNLIETFSFSNMFNLPRANVVSAHSPIFIIGMPRSGTSLVEQIFSAHPEITGGGELIYIQSIIYDLPALVKSSETWPGCILGVNQKIVDSLAERYLDGLGSLADNTVYVTDKMPHNFYALGLIQLLFPNAKIIHCSREPFDTCISVLFQNFKEGHEYSNSLFHLGTHYSQYLRLMEHWRSVLSINMCEIQYEDLVQDPKPVISKMLEYCNLKWDDNCMNFNKIKRYVKTASFDQVRQPLHTRSVNRWKNYDKYLNDLKDGFKRGF